MESEINSKNEKRTDSVDKEVCVLNLTYKKRAMLCC